MQITSTSILSLFLLLGHLGTVNCAPEDWLSGHARGLLNKHSRQRRHVPHVDQVSPILQVAPERGMIRKRRVEQPLRRDPSSTRTKRCLKPPTAAPAPTDTAPSTETTGADPTTPIPPAVPSSADGKGDDPTDTAPPPQDTLAPTYPDPPAPNPTGDTPPPTDSPSPTGGEPPVTGDPTGTDPTTSSPAPSATTDPNAGANSPWVQTKSYVGEDFYQWDFWHDQGDPTHGTVQYVSLEDAKRLNLAIPDGNGAFKISADTKETGDRKSVRITDNQNPWEVGTLVLFDASHMPTGCGTWPAFWANGPDWPRGGEIDILEGVHTNTRNQATLHTSDGCTTDTSQAVVGFTGAAGITQCAVGSDNSGCGIVDNRNDNSYGAGFNAVQGGVYAMQIVDAGISVWFFERANIPADIHNGKPDPSTWGLPVGYWASTTCSMEHFKQITTIINLTFCGDWAGNTWESSGCRASTSAPTCEDYVRNNPGLFEDAYFLINYVKYFTLQHY